MTKNEDVLNRLGVATKNLSRADALRRRTRVGGPPSSATALAAVLVSDHD